VTLARTIDSAPGRPPPIEHMRPLVLGPAAGWVRRMVGPVVWSVLELLTEAAELDGDRTVSCCSVRGVAVELGLANDTVARALRRLGDASLLRHKVDREASGRFGSGRYVLTIPPNVFDLASDVEQPSLPKPAAKPRVPRSSGEQLALLAEG
jgi:hypothetical protein